MKTILTTIFAIAVMVFAFHTKPVMAGSGDGIWASNQPQVDELNDPDQADNERDIADSGNEGSTSAAGANEQ
ncbi:MAG: hypothetical protein OXF09_04805 [Hyphomicrobiales bacterium]|nr:hypothetical protein [Hyphomicrobiales bacterium]